uniref:Uncharacterized protein n=1 Tax=Anopheles atroparvus TaxID=41427 RepID=A0A182J3P0_ANOAO
MGMERVDHNLPIRKPIVTSSGKRILSPIVTNLPLAATGIILNASARLMQNPAPPVANQNVTFLFTSVDVLRFQLHRQLITVGKQLFHLVMQFRQLAGELLHLVHLFRRAGALLHRDRRRRLFQVRLLVYDLLLKRLKLAGKEIELLTEHLFHFLQTLVKVANDGEKLLFVHAALLRLFGYQVGINLYCKFLRLNIISWRWFRFFNFRNHLLLFLVTFTIQITFFSRLCFLEMIHCFVYFPECFLQSLETLVLKQTLTFQLLTGARQSLCQLLEQTVQLYAVDNSIRNPDCFVDEQD